MAAYTHLTPTPRACSRGNGIALSGFFQASSLNGWRQSLLSRRIAREIRIFSGNGARNCVLYKFSPLFGEPLFIPVALRLCKSIAIRDRGNGVVFCKSVNKTCEFNTKGSRIYYVIDIRTKAAEKLKLTDVARRNVHNRITTVETLTKKGCFR